MCKILYKQTEYKGEFVSFPAPTFDYIVVQLSDECLLARTLEYCETCTDYIDQLIFINDIVAIVIRVGITYEDAVKMIESYRSVFKRIYYETK